MSVLTQAQIDFFNEEGYLVVEDLLSSEEISYYSEKYDAILEGKIDTTGLRSDLSGSGEQSKELITQIMVPSKVYPDFLEHPLHNRAVEIAKELLGDDMSLDFDMLINKTPGVSSETPWHQDASYWLDMPDKRAVSFWTAIDPAFLDNGCMWYTPKSHLDPLRLHKQVGSGGALQCEGSESESVFIELNPGSCVLHHGQTVHYSRANISTFSRRAFILNYRPLAMIQYERERGYDHTGERSVKSS